MLPGSSTSSSAAAKRHCTSHNTPASLRRHDQAGLSSSKACARGQPPHSASKSPSPGSQLPSAAAACAVPTAPEPAPSLVFADFLGSSSSTSSAASSDTHLNDDPAACLPTDHPDAAVAASSSGRDGEQRQLTARLRQCRSLAEVGGVLAAEPLPVLNDIHVALAARRLVQLSGVGGGLTAAADGWSQQQQQQQQQPPPPAPPGQLEGMLARLTELSLPVVPAAAPANLSFVAWALLGKLRHHPGADWLAEYGAASYAHLHGLLPAQLAGSLWALARVRHRPGRLWLERWLAAALPGLAGAAPGVLATELWALAALRVPVPAAWVDAWVVASLPALAGGTARELASMAWALAALGHDPGDAWVQAFLRHAAARGGALTAQGLANVVWALAALGRDPGEGWLGPFLLAGTPRLRALSARQAAMLAWGLERLRCRPPRRFLARYLAATQRLLADGRQPVGAQALANMLRGLAAMPDVHPGREWLGAWYTRGRDAGGWTDQGLAGALHALAVLGESPPRSWLRRHLRRCQRALPDFQPQALANTAWALGRLRLWPRAAWLQQFTAACAPVLHELRPEEAGMLLWGLARVGHTPSELWLEAFERRTAATLPRCAPQHLANMLWALARWGYVPAPTWLQGALHALGGHLAAGRCGHQDCTNALWALARLQAPAPGGWLRRWYAASQPLLAAAPDAGLAQVGWAVWELRLRPPAPWVGQLLSAAAPRVASMNALTATSVLLGCAAGASGGAAGDLAADPRVQLLVARARQQLAAGDEGEGEGVSSSSSGSSSRRGRGRDAGLQVARCQENLAVALEALCLQHRGPPQQGAQQQAEQGLQGVQWEEGAVESVVGVLSSSSSIGDSALDGLAGAQEGPHAVGSSAEHPASSSSSSGGGGGGEEDGRSLQPLPRIQPHSLRLPAPAADDHQATPSIALPDRGHDGAGQHHQQQQGGGCSMPGFYTLPAQLPHQYSAAAAAAARRRAAAPAAQRQLQQHQHQQAVRLQSTAHLAL